MSAPPRGGVVTILNTIENVSLAQSSPSAGSTSGCLTTLTAEASLVAPSAAATVISIATTVTLKNRTTSSDVGEMTHSTGTPAQGTNQWHYDYDNYNPGDVVYAEIRATWRLELIPDSAETNDVTLQAC